MRIWQKSMIRELLGQATSAGEARAQLDTRENAEKFRFAIYAFRRAHDIGYDVSITLEGNTVILTKKELPSVTILSENTANVM